MARAGLTAIAVIALVALATPASGRQAEAQVGASRDWAYALAIQPDGKLVAAGRSVGGGWRFALARYTTRGKLDTSFGRGGKVVTSVDRAGNASALAIQRDGKIVAAGQTYVGPELDVALVRFAARGRLDTIFGRGGIVLTDLSPTTKTYDRTRALALQRDGRLVLAGDSMSFSLETSRRVLARYTTRGRLDRGFGNDGTVLSRSGPSESAGGVAIQRDGKIVAAGAEGAGFVVARYTARGRLDPSFGRRGTVSTKLGSYGAGGAVAIEPNGKIVAGGYFGLARYTARGRLDPSFGQGGTVSTKFGFKAFAIEPDGKIVAVGSASWSFGLVRYTADGALDPTFGDGGKVRTRFSSGISSAEGVVIQPDGKIVVAGGGAGYFLLARYTADGKLDPTFGRGGKVQTTLRPAS
jgi:uncharacterized delta-60 repeat protein